MEGEKEEKKRRRDVDIEKFIYIYYIYFAHFIPTYLSPISYALLLLPISVGRDLKRKNTIAPEKKKKKRSPDSIFFSNF